MFLNLAMLEFIGLFAALGAGITVLYLRDLRTRQVRVSTLRFWGADSDRTRFLRRTRIREPWSWLLQLASLLLLLLAIGQLRWGAPGTHPKNYVLLLDVSSATAAPSVLEHEKQAAREYLSRIGPEDRAMLVRAEAVAVPATPFTAERTELRRALASATPSYAALNLEQAFTVADEVENWEPAERGEVVYIGPGRVPNRAARFHLPARLRTILIPGDPRGCAIERLTVVPGTEAESWRATVWLKNYGDAPLSASLHVQFGATPFTVRSVDLAAHGERQLVYDFTAHGAGQLSARLDGPHVMPLTGAAAATLPARGPVALVAYTLRPKTLGLLFDGDAHFAVTYRPPSAYKADTDAAAVILDQFAPAEHPKTAAIWIDPPPAASPVPVLRSIPDATVTSAHAFASHDVRVPVAHVFELSVRDEPLVQVAEQSVALSRRGTPGMALVGFDPFAPALRGQPAMPLLLSEMLRTVAATAFDDQDYGAGTVGLQSVAVSPDDDETTVHILDGERPVPFTLRNHRAEFFVGHPARVEVDSKWTERNLDLRLPEIGEEQVRFTGVNTGEPPIRALTNATELWRYLVVLSALFLLADWYWYGGRSWPGLALKAICLATLAVALLAPAVSVPQWKNGVLVLVDTSRSISDAAFNHAREMVRQIADARGSGWFRVMTFAARPGRLTEPDDIARSNASAETNLEAALTEGAVAIPPHLNARLVLITDGNENRGSTLRALTTLRDAGIPVDVLPVSSSGQRVKLVEASLPANAAPGEDMAANLKIDATRASPAASITLLADGKPIGTHKADLHEGVNTVPVHVRIQSEGSVLLTVRVDTGAGDSTEREQAVRLERPAVLYLSADPPGADVNFLRALEQAQFAIKSDPRLLDESLAGVRLVVLNNIDLNTIADGRKRRLEAYVSNGGGLLVLGGEHAVYKQDQQLDVLDRALPAKLLPPRAPEGTCVALVLDKSSSMEGRKIELARLSAAGVVNHMRPADSIGVLIFDNSYRWAVPLRRATDPAAINRLIAGIEPDGGTQIPPALGEAYRKVQATKASYRHIVLLTDGISEEGDSIALAREALLHQVTISTVGLGVDVNRSFLEKIAADSGGRSYFLSDPQGLADILLKDVEDFTGSTAVERPLTAIVEKPAEILDGVPFQNAPPLKGYARYAARKGAETVLSIDAGKHDPLYVRWQYGLGRVGVFTSDAKSRWAEAWMNWNGFDKLWQNIARDLLARSSGVQASAAVDAAKEDVIASYRYEENAKIPSRWPSLFAIGPDGFEQPVRLEQVNSGEYQARVHIGARQGMFRIRPLAESDSFPEVGVYAGDDESRTQGVNEGLLKEIADTTSGQFAPDPSRLTASSGRLSRTRVELWPVLIGLAIALSISELLVRKLGLRRGDRM